jgi:hypothetical protein
MKVHVFVLLNFLFICDNVLKIKYALYFDYKILVDRFKSFN